MPHSSSLSDTAISAPQSTKIRIDAGSTSSHESRVQAASSTTMNQAMP